MDIGAATQASLKDLKITSAKKQAFRADCRVVVVNIILKLVEKTPMRYCFVRSSTCLALKNIANKQKSASKFRALADGLTHIKKITAKVADMAKFQCNKFQKIVWEKHHSEFDAFDFGKDWLDVFRGKYISDKRVVAYL